MKRAAGVLAALLCFGILTIWVDERWAWSLFQAGIFALAAWRSVRAPRISFRLAFAPLMAAAVWPFLQIAIGTSISRSETWTEGLNWCTFVLLFGLSVELLGPENIRRWFLAVIVASGTVLAFLSTLQNFSSRGRIFWLFPSAYEGDVFGPFVNRNQFAAWVELLLPVALYLAITDRKLRAVYGCAAAVLFSAVIASSSRAGFIVVCGEVLMVAAGVLVQRSAQRRSLVLASLQFLMLAIGAVAVVGWDRLEVRLQAKDADVIRIDAARASVRMVADRPWTGSGLGTWPMVYPRYAGFDSGSYVNQAHNDWLQWAAEGGLPFAILLAIFALLLWKPAVQSIYGLGTVAFLLHALVDYPMQQRPALGAWFFALAGAAWARQSSRDRNACHDSN